MALKASKQENRTLARAARAAITKTPLDIALLNVDCHEGSIDLTGIVRPPRGQAGVMNVKKEYEILKTTIHAVRGVRDVTDRVKVFES